MHWLNYLQAQGAQWIKEQFTEGSPEHLAAHALLACAGAAGGSGDCAGGALGAGSGVILNHLMSQIMDGKPESEEDKQNQLNLVTNLVAGVALATGSSGEVIQAASNAAQIEGSNNYLSDQQIQDYNQEIAQADNLLEEMSITAEYAGLGVLQDGVLATGIGAGLVTSFGEDLSGLAQLLSHPVESLQGLHALYQTIKNDPAVIKQYGADFVASLGDRIDHVNYLMQEGQGIDHSFELGQTLGSLVWDMGLTITGAYGAAKGGVKLAAIGVKLGGKQLNQLAHAANNLKPGQVVSTVGGKPKPPGGGKPLLSDVGKPPGVFTAEETQNLVAQIDKYQIEPLPHGMMYGVENLTEAQIKVTPYASRIFKEYLNQGISMKDAVRYTNDLLKTGMKRPTPVTMGRGSELVKVVPTGSSVGAHSPYFMTRAEYNKLVNLPAHEVADRLGLPAQQGLHGSQIGFDVYAIKPKPNVVQTTVYQSQVAPLEQGSYLAQGGAQQTLVPNRGQWTEPVKIGNIPARRP